LNYQWTVGLVFWRSHRHLRTSTSDCKVAVSLCLSTASKTLAACPFLLQLRRIYIYIYIKVWIVYIYLTPSCLLQTQFFFNGDRVEGTKNPVGERLSGLQKIAEILVVVLMLMTLRHLFSMAVFLSIKTLFHLWMDTGSQNRIAQLYNLVRLCWYFGKL